MATVSPPYKPVNRVDVDQRVRHPLQKLRGHIRTYVTLEGIAIALLFMALWFWIGMLLDYGSFRLFAFDWTYELSESTGAGTANVLRIFVLVLLAGALLALVATKLFLRLFREFREPALALVLERRFPRELGDRLITAVEMADPKVAQQYGFSQEMIDQTIREAAERVEKVPVGEVFNWPRLIWQGVLVVLFTVVLYVVILAAVCIGEGTPIGHYFVRFNHTAGIWAERNLLLMGTCWPRNAHLEFVRLPANAKGEVRVPRDYTAEESRPDVMARSIKYVVADREAPLGWRALTYRDLADRQLLPANVLAVSLPPDWNQWKFEMDDLPARIPGGMIPSEWNWQGKTPAAIRAELKKPVVIDLLDSKRGREVQLRAAIEEMLDWHNWTLDKLELLVTEAPEIKIAMIDQHTNAYGQFNALFEAVRELARDPGMERTLRELDVPKNVRWVAWGKETLSTETKKLPGNKYLFRLNELKESSRLRVHADNFYSSPKQVTLLAPPTLTMIVADKEEPAYLYYRYLKNENLLKGQRQMLRGVAVSKGGTESTINLPADSSLTIRATADRDLRDGVRIVQPDKTEGVVLRQLPTVRLLGDRRTFEALIENVNQMTELDFVFRDQDGVKGIRRVILVPLGDSPALVTDVVLPTPLRLDPRDRNRRIITPSALFPWQGKISDDRGLVKLSWRYEYEEKDLEVIGDEKQSTELDSTVERRKRAVGRVVSNLAYTPGPSTYLFSTAAYLSEAATRRPRDRKSGAVDMVNFKNRLANDSRDDVTEAELKLLLQIHPQHRLLLNRLLEVNISAEQLRDLAKRYQEAGGDEAKRSALDGKLAVPQQSVKRVLDELQQSSQDEFQAAEKLRAFTRDVLAVVPVGSKRNEMAERVRDNAVGVLADLLVLVNDRAEEKDALGKALVKVPEKRMLKDHDLEFEPPFDVAQFKLKVEKKDEAQPHYELKLYIQARDSDVERLGPAPPDAGPFTFLIVSETELNDLMLQKKVELYKLLKETVDKLETRKAGLDSEAIAIKQPSPNVKATVQRLDQTLATVKESGDITRGVLSTSKQLLEEMELNRFSPGRIIVEKDRIVNPLESICDKNRGELATTERFVDLLRINLQNAVAKAGPDQAALQDAGTSKALAKELNGVIPFLLPEKNKNLQNIQLQLLEDLPTARESAYYGLVKEASTQVKDLADALARVRDAIKDLQSEHDLLANLEYIHAQNLQINLRLRQYQIRQREDVWNSFDEKKKK